MRLKRRIDGRVGKEEYMEIQEERKPKSLVAKTVDYCRKNGLKKCLKKIYMKFIRQTELPVSVSLIPH